MKQQNLLSYFFKVDSINYNSFFELPLRSFALSSVSLFVSPCTIARYAAATLQINLLEDRTKSHQS